VTINVLTLDGTTLPSPSAMTMRGEFLGGAVVLADGTLRRDLLDGDLKRRWTLSWVKLTAAQLATVQAEYEDAVAGDVAFNPPDLTPVYALTTPFAQTNAYTVNAGPTPGMTWEAYKAAGSVLYYRASFELFEV
jgi:hypothetical protein